MTVTPAVNVHPIVKYTLAPVFETPLTNIEANNRRVTLINRGYTCIGVVEGWVCYPPACQCRVMPIIILLLPKYKHLANRIEFTAVDTGGPLPAIR